MTRLADSIKERFSRTAGGAYLSNGCQHCDAIQDDWPLGRAVSDYAQSGPLDELPVLAAIEVADATWTDAAGPAEHEPMWLSPDLGGHGLTRNLHDRGK